MAFKVESNTGLTYEGKTINVVNDLDSIKIKGYLHKCDYSASAGIIAEYPNRFLKNSLDNLLKQWQ